MQRWQKSFCFSRLIEVVTSLETALKCPADLQLKRSSKIAFCSQSRIQHLPKFSKGLKRKIFLSAIPKTLQRTVVQQLTMLSVSHAN